jgi:tetratricopeptide (TPR) repeat protein
MTIALLKLLPMLWGFLAACGTQPSNEQAPAEVRVAGEDAPAPRVKAPKVVPVVVTMTPPASPGAFKYQTEAIAVYTLLVEVGLMELQGVIVVTNNRPVSPGLSHPIGETEAPQWTASMKFGDDPDKFEVEFELCTNHGKRCRSTSATGNIANPELAVSQLLEFAQGVLQREPAAGAVGQWKMPVSQDPYAVLICGRSAAAWYGMIDVPPEHELDKQKDPVMRAVFLDPSMALAQWLLGRRYALRGVWDKAMPAFTAAREGRPLMPVFLGDEAVVLEAQRRELAAAEAWESLLEAVPNDPRFLLARVETELHAGRLDQARDQLAVLSDAWNEDSRVAAARVELADKSGEEQGVDDLLAHWAATDPTASEPVRRRIQLRIRQGAYQDAWDMLPTLRERHAVDIADNYEIPLGVALQKWDVAAAAAERVGSPEVATRIRARAGLEQDPKRTPELPGGSGPDGLLVLGRVALAQGDAKSALDYAQRADKLRPWDPDVMTLIRDALNQLGNTSAAQAVAVRIDAAEPPPPAIVVRVEPATPTGQ